MSRNVYVIISLKNGCTKNSQTVFGWFNMYCIYSVLSILTFVYNFIAPFLWKDRKKNIHETLNLFLVFQLEVLKSEFLLECCDPADSSACFGGNAETYFSLWDFKLLWHFNETLMISVEVDSKVIRVVHWDTKRIMRTRPCWNDVREFLVCASGPVWAPCVCHGDRCVVETQIQQQ